VEKILRKGGTPSELGLMYMKSAAENNFRSGFRRGRGAGKARPRGAGRGGPQAGPGWRAAGGASRSPIGL
jgi:hypothetical protein